jgi:uncharacterized protein (TIGR03032 family)
MSVACTPPRREVPQPSIQQPAPVAFNFTQTSSFAPLLKQLGVSLVVTTYQANKLLVLRERAGGLSILVRSFERPMGLAVDQRRIALGTRDQVWQFRNAADIAPQVEPAGAHDACFMPRASHVTGDVGIHEVCWGGESAEELWFVNTRFSCLCTMHPDYSFVPRWRPPFISALAAEDRCHLNGLAIVDGQPRYVTALGQTDRRDGWRAVKARGGCLMSVPDGRVVAEGLCMPHSPRWYRDKLWVLESGTGKILQIDPANADRRTIAEVPGFARGLGFCGPYAFVGLSKIRPTSAMDGVPLAERRGELKAGVAVIDMRSSKVVATVDFHSAVEEVFDVQVLAGQRFPEVLGFHKETVQHTFVVPSETLPIKSAAQSAVQQCPKGSQS